MLPFAPQKRSLLLPHPMPREVAMHLGVFKRFLRGPDIAGTAFNQRTSIASAPVPSGATRASWGVPPGSLSPPASKLRRETSPAPSTVRMEAEGELHLTILRDFVFI